MSELIIIILAVFCVTTYELIKKCMSLSSKNIELNKQIENLNYTIKHPDCEESSSDDEEFE